MNQEKRDRINFLEGKIEQLKLEKTSLEDDLMDLENDLDGAISELEDIDDFYPEDLFPDPENDNHES